MKRSQRFLKFLQFVLFVSTFLKRVSLTLFPFFSSLSIVNSSPACFTYPNLSRVDAIMLFLCLLSPLPFFPRHRSRKKKIRRAKKLSLPVTRETCWFVVNIDQKYMYPSTCTGFLDEKIAKIFKISTICIIRFNFFKTSKFNFIPFLSLDRQLFSRLFHLYPLLSNLHIQTFFIDIHRYRD